MRRKPSNPAMLPAALLLLLLGGFKSCFGLRCGPSAAEVEAEAEQRRRAEKAALEAQAAEQGRKNEEQIRRFKEKQEAPARELEKRRESFRRLSPAEREGALRDACRGAGEGCDPDTRRAIAEAATSDAEKAKLQALGEQLGRHYDERMRREAVLREQFMRRAQAQLDGAGHGITSSDGDTLVVRQFLGSDCESLNRQIAALLVEGQKVGFKRYRCIGKNYRRGTEVIVERDL